LAASNEGVDARRKAKHDISVRTKADC
jgi:hypothetical protein